MKNTLQLIFGGLTTEFLVRQYIFSLIIGGFYLNIFLQGTHAPPSIFIITLIINTLLYPYARFAYKSSVKFLLGDSTYIVNIIALLVFKLMTVFLCWIFAIFAAPIGLAFNYYQNRKLMMRKL